MTRVALHVYRANIPTPTGVHRYAASLTRALGETAPAGCAAELWTGAEPGVPDHLGSVPVQTWPVPRRALHLAWTLVKRPYADRYLHGPDLVHTLTPVVPVPTRLPLVVTVHDLLVRQHPEWYERSERWIVARAIDHAVAAAAHLITPSERVRSDLCELLGVDASRVKVVPEGVAGVFTRPAQADVTAAYGVRPGGYFITVGEVGPRKNLPTLLEAMADLTSRGDKAMLVVAGGDGSGAEETKLLAARLGLQDVVRFVGHVDDETLAALVQGARALVHPSLYEGFGLTPLEAMAAGTAVVSSSAGSLPEVVGAAGLLVDPHDVAAWTTALERARDDDGWVTAAVEAGRARAAQFTWEVAARRTWAVYDEVLGC